MIYDVGAQTRDICRRAPGGAQHSREVGECLAGLGRVIARPDDVGLRIPGHLPGEMQSLAALLQRRVREAELEAVVELLGIDAFDAHGCLRKIQSTSSSV